MKTTLVLLAGLAVLAVAVAGAAIPDSSGVIHGCFGKGGVLRVIDPTADSCGKQQTPLDWNVQGPAGAQGPVGPAGPQGPKGDPGPPATSRFAVVHADGTLAASGGVVSIEKVGTGSVMVGFSAPIADCAATATVRIDDATVPSFAMTGRVSASQVQVMTFRPGGGVFGSPVDEGFELVVVC